MRHREEQPTKAFTLRLPVQEAEQLEAIAGAKNRSINQELTEAVHAYVSSEFAKPEFQQQLKDWIDGEYQRLERTRAGIVSSAESGE